MKLLMTCEICGSAHLIKTNGSFMCENCGTEYTPDEVRSLWNAQNAASENAAALNFMDRQLERYHERKLERMRLESEERRMRLARREYPRRNDPGCLKVILVGAAIVFGIAFCMPVIARTILFGL